MRSAIAPVMSAGVITANIIWNAENDSGGIGTPPKPVAGTVLAWSMNARSKLPIHFPVPLERERVHAHRPQHAHDARGR